MLGEIWTCLDQHGVRHKFVCIIIEEFRKHSSNPQVSFTTIWWFNYCFFYDLNSNYIFHSMTKRFNIVSCRFYLDDFQYSDPAHISFTHNPSILTWCLSLRVTNVLTANFNESSRDAFLESQLFGVSYNRCYYSAGQVSSSIPQYTKVSQPFKQLEPSIWYFSV